jgi:O-antigen/teichoic acid export membrane protein
VVSVILAMNLGLGSASVIACAVLAVPFVNLVNSVLYFGFQNPALRPRLGYVDIAAATDLLRLGLRFFLLSILTCAALNLDGLLSAHVLGLSAAANYALVARLFGALGLLVTLVCLPLWPANAEAMARGDLAWVRHNTRLMLVLSGCVVGVSGLVLVLVGNDILHAWVRSPELVAMPTSLLVSLLFWSVLVAVAAPLFMVQNSIGLLGPQLLGWAAFLASSVVLKILLARSMGITGIPLAGCLSYAVAVVPAAVLGYRRSLETAEEKLLSAAGASCHV